MLNIDVLIDTLFTDLPPEQRIAEIAGRGFKFVETWMGGDADPLKVVGDACEDNGVKLVSIVMNFATDEAVAPIRPESLDQFLERIDRYADNALAAGCSQGIVTSGHSVEGKSYQAQRAVLVEALRRGGEKAASKGFTLNLEPLNTEVDHAGYFLNDPKEGVAIVKEVGLDNVRLLYDVYHMEIMTGNQTEFITRNIAWIGHFHSAGVPGRHELFLGETNYPFLLDQIERAGYRGYFGMEYMPSLPSGESLEKTWNYLAG